MKKNKMSLMTELDLTREGTAEMTRWCILIALHQSFGIGAARLNKILARAEKLGQESLDVAMTVNDRGMPSTDRSLALRRSWMPRNVDPDFRVPVLRSPRTRREEQLRMAGDVAAGMVWTLCAKACMDELGFSTERLLRLKEEALANYRQVNEEGHADGLDVAMEHLRRCAQAALKLYGTKPSDYQMSSIQCSGVAKGAHQSLCVINETLYYLSMDGVMAWDGSLPTKVSASLDEERLSHVTRAAAGGLVGRYYLHTESSGGQRLLVYDTEKGLWHEEDATGWAMCSTGRQLYLWDKEAIWAADGSREASGEEDTVEYEAVTGDIGLGSPDDKYCSRVTVRLDAMERTVVTLWASFDGGEWQEMGRVDTAGKRVRVNLPFVPTRHDTMRLRLTGKGQIAVRSIAMTLSSSEGGRVNGGVPRRG